MKKISSTRLLLCLAVIRWSFAFITDTAAQTFASLYSFTAENNGLNRDGAAPMAGLVLSNSLLYGTASRGGASGRGAVFRINTDGNGFTNLHSFGSGSGFFPNITNSEGAFPETELVLSGNTLYGTAAFGGDFGQGTVFVVNTAEVTFAVLHTFTGDDGAAPQGGLILNHNLLYGTASAGGSFGNGTVFKINIDDSTFSALYDFTALDPSNPDFSANTDGAYPIAGLVLDGNMLYGAADSGGDSGGGTLFAINSDGTGFLTLHSFTFAGDQAAPDASMVLAGGALYGTSHHGASTGFGTVFKVKTDGNDFETLHTFSPLDPATGTNSDGVYPSGGLTLLGNTLYGTASGGGLSGSGTVFKLNTDGTGFSVLHSFSSRAPNSGTNNDGAFPLGTLVVRGNTLYGTTSGGGTAGNGTIFSIALPAAQPQLAISRVAANVIVAWPTNAAGFTLQSTTNLAPSAIWTPVSSVPAVVNAQNTVTNPIPATRQFFRLAL